VSELHAKMTFALRPDDLSDVHGRAGVFRAIRSADVSETSRDTSRVVLADPDASFGLAA